MNAAEKKWLIDTITDLIIKNKEIHDYNSFEIKLFTNENSPNIPIHITTDTDELIYFSVVNIVDQSEYESPGINYNPEYEEITLGNGIEKEKEYHRLPRYYLNKKLSLEIEKEILG